jgi:hypothetical protein
MKLKLALFILGLSLASCMSKSDNTIEDNAIQNNSKLRHVVLFKFKDSATTENIKKIEHAFSALESKIDEIEEFEWGINNSPENLNKGFTHSFLITFNNEEAREIYLPHPSHQEFVNLLQPYLEDVLVIDYWVK